MFCPNCGTQVAEGVRFCSKCGSAVNQAPAAPVYQSAPQYVIPVAPQPARENPMIERVRTAVRKIGGSPLFLVVAICYTLVQLYALLTVGATGGNVISGWIPFLREFGFSSSDINDMISAFNDTGWLVKLISLTFGILTMSGLWAIFAASHSSAKEPGTAGLTIIRVVTADRLPSPEIIRTGRIYISISENFCLESAIFLLCLFYFCLSQVVFLVREYGQHPVDLII